MTKEEQERSRATELSYKPPTGPELYAPTFGLLNPPHAPLKPVESAAPATPTEKAKLAIRGESSRQATEQYLAGKAQEPKGLTFAPPPSMLPQITQRLGVATKPPVVPESPVATKPPVVPESPVVTKPTAPTTPAAVNTVTATGIPGIVRQGNAYSREGEQPLTGGGVSVVPAYKPPVVETPAVDLTRDVRGNLMDEINKAGMRRERDVATKNQLAQSELQLRQQGQTNLNEMAQARLGLDQQEAQRAQARDALTAEATGLGLAKAKREAELTQKFDAAKTDAERAKILNQLGLSVPKGAESSYKTLTVDDNGVKTERLVRIDPTTNEAQYVTPRETDYNRMADQWVAATGLTGEAAAKLKAEILATANQ